MPPKEALVIEHTINRIEVSMGENVLVIETNGNGVFDKEIMCFIENSTTGEVIQDIAIIRPKMSYKNDAAEYPTFSDKEVEVMVYGDEQDEDYTDRFVIPLLEKED